jgi:hypothetical protein
MAHCRPQASFTDSFEEIFPSRMVFITKLGPQVSLSPVPFFGVNTLFFEAVEVDAMCLFNLSFLVELDSWSSEGDIRR